ncbi:hypothetical protein F5888DRAFT_1804541 [Russula emetica]|nr:hypothetical protein F5888DRAFT_1804541 [Russula emetica]
MKRRHSDQDAQSRSDTSSNGIDTETDVGHSGASSAQNTRRVREKMLSHSASPSAPPHPPSQPVKKKRTRTLTTPHQSAALHALLAQSRFPTTAMREQVGRSIGLSARKVQVWFQASISLVPLVFVNLPANSQNQRQKARRPRDSKNQGSPVAPARPPQYGPFPNVPAAPFLHSSASSTVNPPSLPSDELYATTHSASAPFVHFNANRGQQQQPASSSGLSGPGVPGVASSSSSSSFAAPPRFPHTPQRQQQPQMQTLAPLAEPSSQTRSPLTRDVHSINSTSSARQVMPSRDFTFNHPFPPLHLQVPEPSGVLSAGQNQYPTMIPLRPLTASSHHSLVLSSSTSSGRPRSQHTSSPSSSSPSPPSSFAHASASVSESRPQTPVSSFLVPRHRDLPRLRILPLHVPESPYTNTHANNTHAHARHVHVQQQQQRSALPRYSPPPLSLPPPPRDPTRFSHSQPPPDRALPSLFRSTSSTSSRGGEISPVPAHASMSASVSSSSSRARRFDPVREAASECSRSGSLGTDTMSTGTPPRIDTPKRLTTSLMK